MIRKYITVFLSIALCFSYISISAAEEYVTENENTGVIEALGIMKNDAVKEGSITRGEFAAMVCRMRGYEAPLSEKNEGKSNSEYMNMLSAFNIINGYDDGDYRSEQFISFDEAYTVLVRCLGYGIIAESNGGYPGGYMRKAYELKLNKGVSESGKAAVSFSDAVMLCYNALFSEYLELSAIEGNKPVYRVAEGNILSDVFNVYRCEGVLDGVDLTRLSGKNDVRPFFISIDGFEIERGEDNCYNLLGYNVCAYYRHAKDENPQLLYIEKSGKNTEITVDICDIADIKNQYVEYYPDGIELSMETKRINLAGFKNVVYNGVSTNSEFDTALIDGKSGTVRFINNDNDSSYEVICVEAYKDYVVSKTDAGLKKIYNKLNTSESVVLDNTVDDPYTIIFDDSGRETGVESIKQGDVVSVYTSNEDAHQHYIRAFVSREVLSGVITGEESAFEKITVGGVQYKLTEECLRKFDGKIVLGSSYKLFLNRAGLVAFLEPSAESTLLVGYLKKTKYISDYDETGMQMRIAVISGNSFEFGTYNVAQRFELDGVQYNMNKKESAKKAVGLLNTASKILFGNETGNDVTAQFISFKINDEGEIIIIDTLLGDADGSPATIQNKGKSGNSMILKSGDNLSYRQSNSENIAFLGTDIHCRRNTPVFNYAFPGSNDDYLDENNYFMGNAEGSFSSSGRCDGILHAVYTDDKFRADYLGREYSVSSLGTIGTHERIAAIERVFTTIDENGQQVYGLEIISNNQNMKLKAKNDLVISGMTSDKDPSLKKEMKAGDLKTGDLIRYVTDKDGYAIGMNLYYRAENGIINPTYFTGASYAASNRFNKAYVMKKYSDGFLMKIADSVEEAAAADFSSYEYVTEYGETGFILYDSTKGTKKRLSVSSMNDFKAYDEVGEDCSEIIIHQYNGMPFGIYIIKR